MTSDFVGPWAGPKPISDMINSLSPAALRRFIASLTKSQYEEFWRQLIEEADRVPPADPREALRWHAHKELSARFSEWFAGLDLVEKSKAYLALLAGTPLDEIMKGSQ
jgi:hypothetical protein